MCRACVHFVKVFLGGKLEYVLEGQKLKHPHTRTHTTHTSERRLVCQLRTYHQEMWLQSHVFVVEVAHEPDLAQGALPLQVPGLGVVEDDLLDGHRLVRLVRRLIVFRRTAVEEYYINI